MKNPSESLLSALAIFLVMALLLWAAITTWFLPSLWPMAIAMSPSIMMFLTKNIGCGAPVMLFTTFATLACTTTVMMNRNLDMLYGFTPEQVSFMLAIAVNLFVLALIYAPSTKITINWRLS